MAPYYNGAVGLIFQEEDLELENEPHRRFVTRMNNEMLRTVVDVDLFSLRLTTVKLIK